MKKNHRQTRTFHVACQMAAAALVLQALSLAACTEIPEEKSVSHCIPAGQCPDVPASTSLIEGDATQGARLYALHCASCHGNDGKGAKPGTGDLTKTNLHTASSSAQLAATIRNGRGVGMPAFPLSHQSIANLVAFVRSISDRAPTAPTPNRYP